MNSDRMRVRIGELRGFTNVSADGLYGHRDDLCGSGVGRCYMGNPINDLNAAITLLDKLSADGWHWELYNLEEGYSCDVEREGMERCIMSSAPTAAEAICGAYLRVHGAYEETE
jgi:hypothetical protein